MRSIILQLCSEYAVVSSGYMAHFKSIAPVISAVVAAAVILPAVVYFSRVSGGATDDKNNAKGNPQSVTMTHGDLPMSMVPEGNTGIVLIPFVGAILALHLFRARTARNKSV